MKKRVGLYGGTFNPLHFGHLNLAIELKEKHALDEVWFVPAALSPLRIQDPPIEAHHRLNMLTCILDELNGFQISELELKRPSPSFTIDTVKKIFTDYPDPSFYLLLGEDTVLNFRDWQAIDELVHLIPLLIGSRSVEGLLKHLFSLGFNKQLMEAVQQGVTPTRQLEISSTDIRKRLEKKLYCGHLVPAKILDYIYDNQLYFKPMNLSQ